jgi:ABC-2 type transport system ATP-binding protein
MSAGAVREPAIVLDRVVKRYGATTALAGLSLDVKRGEMYGLIGPDGAGKTTAIRLICGLLHPDEGELRVLGLSPVRDHRAVTERVGYLSQRFSLYGDLTIDENIAFFAEVHGMRDYRARRDQLLAMTQLTPFRRRLADRLSGGMKQKLALACTLVHEPEVILLDEPTTGVDPVSRREFWKLLSEFLANGLTIVMTTPYLDEAERCARVALLHEGRLLALDEPAVLQARLRDRIVEVIADMPRPPIEVLAGVSGVEDVQIFGERAHVLLATGTQEAAVARIETALRERGITALSVRPVPATLEDVFIGLITGGTAGGDSRPPDGVAHA